MLGRVVLGLFRRDGLILSLHESGGRGIHHEVEAALMTAVTDAEARPRFTPTMLNNGAKSGTTPKHVRLLEPSVGVSVSWVCRIADMTGGATAPRRLQALENGVFGRGTGSCPVRFCHRECHRPIDSESQKLKGRRRKTVRASWRNLSSA